MKQTQLIFDFSTKQDHGSLITKDFVFCAENKNAVDFLQKFFDQKSFAKNTIPSLIIKGEKGCGKTHLLYFFSQKFHTIFLQKDDLLNINSPTFFVENSFYILENIDEIKNEETLLHIINSAAEAHAFLILSATNLDDFILQDLVSRIKNIFTVEIKNPSKDLIRLLLSQGLSEKQLKVDEDVIEFLSNRLSPSYKTIGDALKMIEICCHENKKKFTLTEAKRLIG